MLRLKRTHIYTIKMPTPTIIVHHTQHEQMMNDINAMLQRLIVDDIFEFEHLDIVTRGLTPRMRVNMYEELGALLRNLVGGDHPTILKNIVNSIMYSLDSAIYALFSVRNKNTFTALEIKTYLYNHLEWLLDIEEHGPSLLGNYITTDRQL